MSDEEGHAFLRWIDMSNASEVELEEREYSVCKRVMAKGEGRYQIGCDYEEGSDINAEICEDHTDELVNLNQTLKELRFRIAEKAGIVKREHISPSTYMDTWQESEEEENSE